MCSRESWRILNQGMVQWLDVLDVEVLLLVLEVWGHWDDRLRIQTNRYAECFVGEALWRCGRGEAVGGGELNYNIVVRIGCRIMGDYSMVIRGKAMTVRT